MSPTRIGIDLTESPLRVGGLLLGRYIVAGASKGLKLRGAGASTTREEVVACLEDARNVVKGFFGAPAFDAAVLVVPNTISKEHHDNIISYGRGGGFNITQVISEHTAVSAAYVEKVKPTEATKLAIISLTSSILEVSVVSINPLDVRNQRYSFGLEQYKAHDEAIEDLEDSKHHEQESGGLLGFVGGAVKALVVDPFEKAFNILKNILGTIEGSSKVEKVVFVGKASRSEKVRRAVKEAFPDAEVWEGMDNPEEVPAYGAAFLSYLDKEMPMYPTNSSDSTLEEVSKINDGKTSWPGP